MRVQPKEMNRPVRARLGRAVPQWVKDGSLFFITINCAERHVNSLCRADVGTAVLEAARFNNAKLVWNCRLMLLMPDHLHAIISFPREIGLKIIVTNWKKFLAREQGIQWQRDFFDHRLRNHHEVAAKASYILMNPVRKGLCERAEHWPWVWMVDR
jgi:putative transposase